MPRDPSRWWYALVPFPILVGLWFILVGLVRLLLPSAGPSFTEALPVLLPAVAAPLVGALVIVTAPLFVAGVLLDIRALKNDSSWSPHWGFGALGVIPVLGLFVKVLALLSIPATLAYLGRRRQMVGVPLGDTQPAESAPATDPTQPAESAPTTDPTQPAESAPATDPTQPAESAPATDPTQPASSPSRSRWWYGIIIPPVVELTGKGLLWTVQTTGLLRQGGNPLTLLVPVAFVLVAIGLVPIFAISLYRDATAVRNASGVATPDPRVWGLVGLGSLIGLVLVGVTFMPLIALAYLHRR